MAVDTHYLRMKKAGERNYDDYPEDIVRSFARGGSSRELAARGNRYDEDARYASRDYDRQPRDWSRDRQPRDWSRDRGEYRDRRDDRRGERDFPPRERSRERDGPSRNGYAALRGGNELVHEASDSKRPKKREPDEVTLDRGVRRGRTQRLHSDEGEFDSDKWRELANMGELDIYTCLGLSDVTTWTVDTQKLVFKILAAMTMQLIVPGLMLYMEIVKWRGEDAQALPFNELVNHLKPNRSGIAFRGIGFTMLLYSLYSMYKNAIDECRASALHFCLQEGVKSGVWWPLMIGEFVNICVSVILLFAMYFIFINITDGADLILNAVAVNFLGDVDGEFVDREAFEEGVENFDKLMEKYKYKPPEKRPCWGKVLENFLQFLLVLFLLLGVSLAFIFLVSPSRDGQAWYEGY